MSRRNVACGKKNPKQNKPNQKKSFPASTTTLLSSSFLYKQRWFLLRCVFARVNKEAKTQSSPSALSATNKPCSEGSNKNPFLSFWLQKRFVCFSISRKRNVVDYVDTWKRLINPRRGGGSGGWAGEGEGVAVGGIKGGGFNPCKRVQAACKLRGFGCWCDIATAGTRLPAGEEIVPNCSWLAPVDSWLVATASLACLQYRVSSFNGRKTSRMTSNPAAAEALRTWHLPAVMRWDPLRLRQLLRARLLWVATQIFAPQLQSNSRRKT